MNCGQKAWTEAEIIEELRSYVETGSPWDFYIQVISYEFVFFYIPLALLIRFYLSSVRACFCHTGLQKTGFSLCKMVYI
jgi:hypothetical protein